MNTYKIVNIIIEFKMKFLKVPSFISNILNNWSRILLSTIVVISILWIFKGGKWQSEETHHHSHDSKIDLPATESIK